MPNQIVAEGHLPVCTACNDTGFVGFPVYTAEQWQHIESATGNNPFASDWAFCYVSWAHSPCEWCAEGRAQREAGHTLWRVC